MRESFATYPRLSFQELAERLEEALPDLPKQEARLAQYMLLNLDTIGLETGRSLAEKVGGSEVTVGRLLRRMGCDGMKGLKAMLREQYAVSRSIQPLSQEARPIDAAREQTLKAEIEALHSVFRQASGESWARMTTILRRSDKVYVTGFQSVRGVAEDFARRLAIARPSVQYLSPHDGMLAEWLPTRKDREEFASSCLLVIDVVPYANEATRLVQIARQQKRKVIVVSDEFCHWAGEMADEVFYAPSRSGLFLESTVAIVCLLNLIVDAAAGDGETAKLRVNRWTRFSRELRLFS